MATVIRGFKSRVIGFLAGSIFVALGVGLYVFTRLSIANASTGELAVIGFLGLVALFGLVQIGKAVIQSEYRIILNSHRGEWSIQLGHPLFR